MVLNYEGCNRHLKTASGQTPKQLATSSGIRKMLEGTPARPEPIESDSVDLSPNLEKLLKKELATQLKKPARTRAQRMVHVPIIADVGAIAEIEDVKAGF